MVPGHVTGAQVLQLDFATLSSMTAWSHLAFSRKNQVDQKLYGELSRLPFPSYFWRCFTLSSLKQDMSIFNNILVVETNLPK